MSISGIAPITRYDAYKLAEPRERNALAADVEDQARELWRELKARIEVIDAYQNGDGVDFCAFEELVRLAKGQMILVRRK